MGVGGNLPVDSAVFLGVYFPYQRSCRDGLNLDDRVCTSITPVSLNGFICMVGCRSADRKSGKYLEALVDSESFI